MAHRTSLVMWAAAALAIAGCANESSEDLPQTLDQILAVKREVLSRTATPKAFQASELLTNDDIREITGYTIVKKAPGQAQGIFQNGCEWELNGNAVVTWRISLGVMSPGGLRYFHTYLNLDNLPLLPGLGDIAISPMKGDIIAVKGDTLVSISYFDFTESKEDVPRKLIERIVSRLP